MKKIINPILFSLLIFGCSDDLENSQQQLNFGESLQFESLNFVEKKELLEKSENVLKIHNLSDEVKKSINEKDFQKLLEHKNELIKELDILYNKYGKTNFNNFMVELEYDIVSNQYQIQGIEPTFG